MDVVFISIFTYHCVNNDKYDPKGPFIGDSLWLYDIFILSRCGETGGATVAIAPSTFGSF